MFLATDIQGHMVTITKETVVQARLLDTQLSDNEGYGGTLEG